MRSAYQGCELTTKTTLSGSVKSGCGSPKIVIPARRNVAAMFLARAGMFCASLNHKKTPVRLNDISLSLAGASSTSYPASLSTDSIWSLNWSASPSPMSGLKMIFPLLGKGFNRSTITVLCSWVIRRFFRSSRANASSAVRSLAFAVSAFALAISTCAFSNSALALDVSASSPTIFLSNVSDLRPNALPSHPSSSR